MLAGAGTHQEIPYNISNFSDPLVGETETQTTLVNDGWDHTLTHVKTLENGLWGRHYLFVPLLRAALTKHPLLFSTVVFPVGLLRLGSQA